MYSCSVIESQTLKEESDSSTFVVFSEKTRTRDNLYPLFESTQRKLQILNCQFIERGGMGMKK